MNAVATETAERILDAACEIIAEEGIDEVRIARVATRARASSGLVHHYFSTREELLEQALVHSFERAGDDRFGDGTTQPPGSASETFGLAIRECLPFPGEAEREWSSGLSSGFVPFASPGSARSRPSSMTAIAAGSRP